MISRCYNTAICSPTQSIYNATVLAKLNGAVKSPKGIEAPSTGAQKKRPPLDVSLTCGKRSYYAIMLLQSNVTMQRNKKPSIWDRYSQQQQQPPASPADANAGTIGPSVAGQEFDGKPRYVQYWQRLLKRKESNQTAASSRRGTTPTTTWPPPPPLPDKAEEISAEAVPEDVSLVVYDYSTV